MKLVNPLTVMIQPKLMEIVFNELDINDEFETLLDKKINLTEKNSVFY